MRPPLAGPNGESMPRRKQAKDALGHFAKGSTNALDAHPQWKGDAVAAESSRSRIRRRMAIDQPCERCGAKAHDRHHRDGNPLNNDTANIELLCRKCHMHEDGRAAKTAGQPHDKRGRFTAHEKPRD